MAKNVKQVKRDGPPKGTKERAGWKPVLFWCFLGLGVVSFLVAVVATFALPNAAEPWLVGAVIGLVIALTGEVVLLVMGGGRVFDQEEEWYDWEEEAEKPKATQMILKCAKCMRTFPLLDDGTRPLRAECPHCGRGGFLKDPQAPTPR